MIVEKSTKKSAFQFLYWGIVQTDFVVTNGFEEFMYEFYQRQMSCLKHNNHTLIGTLTIYKFKIFMIKLLRRYVCMYVDGKYFIPKGIEKCLDFVLFLGKFIRL